MASRSAIEAGRAVFRLNADNDPFVRALRQAEAKLRAFAKTMASISAGIAKVGAAITGPLIAASLVFAKTGDAAAKMARRTGLTAESVTALGFAAKQSGSDITAVEGGFRRMARSIQDLSDGSSTAVRAFGALGLGFGDLAGLSPEEQFLLIADRLSRVTNATTRAALAMELFGRAGTGLIPMLEGGAGGIRRLMQEARDLGIVMSNEDAAAAEVLSDAIGRVTSTATALSQAIGAALAPALTIISNTIATITGVVRRWIDENRVLIVGIAAAGASLLGLAALIAGVGIAAQVAAFALGGFATVIGVIGAALSAILSPIGLVVVAATALGAVVAVQTGAAARAVEALKAAFQALDLAVGDTVRAIIQSLLSGDFATAGQLIADLFGVGLDLAKAKALSLLNDLQSSAIRAAVETGTGMRLAWTDALAGIQNLIAGAGGVIRKLWEKITSEVAKVIGSVIAVFDPRISAEDIAADIEAELKKKNTEIDAETKTKKDAIAAGQAATRDRIAKDQDDLLRSARAFTSTIDLIADAIGDRANARLKDIQKRAKEILDRTGQKPEPEPGGSSPEADLDDRARAAESRVFATFRASEASQLAAKAIGEKMVTTLTSMDRTLKQIERKPTGMVFA